MSQTHAKTNLLNPLVSMSPHIYANVSDFDLSSITGINLSVSFESELPNNFQRKKKVLSQHHITLYFCHEKCLTKFQQTFKDDPLEEIL